MVDLQEEVKEEIYNLIDSFEWELEVKELVYQHIIGNYKYQPLHHLISIHNKLQNIETRYI